jgi:hypothetical protein
MTLPSQERIVDVLDLLRSADCGINGISEKHQETEGNCDDRKDRCEYFAER